MGASNSPSPAEREAIGRLRAGDIAGLEMLVRQYQVEAIRVAHMVVRDRDLAEDIVCAAFLRVYERIAQFDDRRSFRPWFLRCVLNDALKAAERGKRQMSLGGDRSHREEAAPEFATELGPEGIAERRELRDAIADAVRLLTPRQRSAIVLRYYLGLTGPEIAAALSTREGTIKRRLHDGRSQLRVLLAHFAPEPSAPAVRPLPEKGDTVS